MLSCPRKTPPSPESKNEVNFDEAVLRQSASLDRLEERHAIPQPFDPIFSATTLGELLVSFLAGIFGSRIERVPEVATGARPAVVLAGRPTA